MPCLPVAPCIPLIPSLAKYIKEFCHSQRTPLVKSIPTELGTMNVASLNNTDVSSVFALAIAPSSLAPRPASPASNP